VALDYLRQKLIDLAIVVAPTVNIQSQWVDELNRVGVLATDEASNANLRWRHKAGVKPTEHFQAIVITYQQLAQDAPLFVAIASKYKIMLIGDEIHHADDSAAFGKALADLADEAKYRLALSGTPFNTKGGALAMCDHADQIDADGHHIRRTLALYEYSFADAIAATPQVCRPIEFIKMVGVGQATYKSLLDNHEFTRLIDLARQNKSDRLGSLLEASGDFMGGMIRTALEKLADLQQHDRKAGMLVVARDTAHGHAIMQRIKQIQTEKAEWRFLTLTEIYNDTPAAHKMVEALRNDNTDIIVSVRMISEGVDIKRLRVGLFATDYLTKMFFMQFVGRFCRWEPRLSGNIEHPQFGWVIIPGHITLLEYARSIERMVFDAAVRPDGTGEPGEEKVEPQNVFVGAQSAVTDSGVIFRSQEDNERNLAQTLFDKVPEARGVITETLAIAIARGLNVQGAAPVEPSRPPTADWRGRNNEVARRLAQQLANNGNSDRAKVFADINQKANRAVNIGRMDGLTPVPVLIRRHQFLSAWLHRVIFGDPQNAPDFNAIFGKANHNA
jgi:superfamily II DNA or RNA helicase